MNVPTSTIEDVKTVRFDKGKAYVPQEGEGQAFFDDGREVELLHFVYSHPSIEEIRGSPSNVVKAIDEYGRKKNYLMNVGDDKGKIVTNLIAEVKPQCMVELGGYVGYSALRFGHALREAGGKRYFSLERNPEFGAVIMALVELAGLSDIVRVVIGSSTDSIKRLFAAGELTRIDMMFLDHYKPAYVTDLKLCEHLQLVSPGTMLVADNVIHPGNPPYLEYVRSSVQIKREKAKSTEPEMIDVSGFGRTMNMYKAEEISLKAEVTGNPNLIYESKLVNSFEPTGVPDGLEITKCVGVQGE